MSSVLGRLMQHTFYVSIEKGTSMNKTYLGDALYAQSDSLGVILSTNRDGVEHYVVLEPDVLDALILFLKANNWIDPLDGN